MKVVECSLCRRGAAWTIEGELFCERHKEAIIERFGVDQFEIRRLTEIERFFRYGGHASIPSWNHDQSHKGIKPTRGENKNGQNH